MWYKISSTKTIIIIVFVNIKYVRFQSKISKWKTLLTFQ